MRNYDLDDDEDEVIRQLMKSRPIASLGNTRLGDKSPTPLFSGESPILGETFPSISEATLANRPSTSTFSTQNQKEVDVSNEEQVSASALAAAARVAKQKAMEKRIKETFGLGTKEENLGSNFFMTPWIKPSFDRAEETRTSQLFRGGSSVDHNISVLSSPDLGLGLRLYFQFLISMTIGLMVMIFFSLPLMVFGYFGTGMPNQNEDAVGFFRLSLGNIGFEDPAPVNNFLTTVPLCSSEAYSSTNQTCVNVLGFKFSMRQVHLTITGGEVLQVIILVIVIQFLMFRLERMRRPDKGENLVSITHYAVYVDNLPSFVTAEEVIAHFSSLYQLQDADWRNRLPIEDARPVQSIDNSGMQIYAGTWVAEVTLYRKIGKLIRAYKHREQELFNLVRSRAVMKRYSLDSPHPLGPSANRFELAELRMIENAREIDAFFCRTRRIQGDMARSYRNRRGKYLYKQYLKTFSSDISPEKASRTPLPNNNALWDNFCRLFVVSTKKESGEPVGSVAERNFNLPVTVVSDESVDVESQNNTRNDVSRPSSAALKSGEMMSPRPSTANSAAAIESVVIRPRSVPSIEVDHTKTASNHGSRPSSAKPSVDVTVVEGEFSKGDDLSKLEASNVKSIKCINDFIDTTSPITIDDADVVGAAVVFEYNESFARCLDDYLFYSQFPFSFFYPQKMKLHGRKLRVRRAAEPDQIIIENLEYSDSFKFLLAFRTAMITSVLLLLCFSAVFLGATLRSAYAQRLPDSAMCTLAVPSMYAPQYAADISALRTLELNRPPDALYKVNESIRSTLDFRCATLLDTSSAFFAMYARKGDFSSPSSRYSFAGCLGNASSLQSQILSTPVTTADPYDFDWSATLLHIGNNTNSPLSLCPRYSMNDVNLTVIDSSASLNNSNDESGGANKLFCPCLSLRSEERCELAPCQLGLVRPRSEQHKATNTSRNIIFISTLSQCEVPASNVAACYCSAQSSRWMRNNKLWRLIGRLFTRETASSALKSTDDEASHCAEYDATFLSASIVEYGLVLITVVVNRLLKLALIFLTKYEGHASLDDAQRSVLMKLFIATFINTAGVVLLAYGISPPGFFLSGADKMALDEATNQYSAEKQDVDRWLFVRTGLHLGPHTDFTRAWFGNIGFYFATTLIFSSMGPIFLPLCSLLCQKPLYRRMAAMSLSGEKFFHSVIKKVLFCLPVNVKEPVLQSDLDSLLLSASFLFTAHAAQISSMLAVAFTFAAGLPILQIIALLVIVALLRLDIYMLLRVSRKPPALDERIMKTLLGMITPIVACRLIVGTFMFSQPDILDPNIFWASVGLSGDSMPGALHQAQSSSSQGILRQISLKNYLIQLSGLRALLERNIDSLTVLPSTVSDVLKYVLLRRCLQPMSAPLFTLLILVLFLYCTPLLWKWILMPIYSACRGLFRIRNSFLIHKGKVDAFATSREKGYLHPFELVATANDPLRCEAAPFTGIYYQFLHRKSLSNKQKEEGSGLNRIGNCLNLNCCKGATHKYALENESRKAGGALSHSAKVRALGGSQHETMDLTKTYLKPQEEKDGWEVAEMGLEFVVKVCTWQSSVQRDVEDAQSHMRGQHKRTFEVLRQYRFATYRLEDQPSYRSAWLALRDQTLTTISSLAQDYANKIEDYPLRHRPTFNPGKEEKVMWKFLVQRWLRRAEVAPGDLKDNDDGNEDSMHLDSKLHIMKEAHKEMLAKQQAEAEALALQQEMFRLKNGLVNSNTKKTKPSRPNQESSSESESSSEDDSGSDESEDDNEVDDDSDNDDSDGALEDDGKSNSTKDESSNSSEGGSDESSSSELESNDDTDGDETSSDDTENEGKDIK